MSTPTSPPPAGETTRTVRVVDGTGHVYLESDVPEGVDPWWTVRNGLVLLLRGQHGTSFAGARLPEGRLTSPSWLEDVSPRPTGTGREIADELDRREYEFHDPKCPSCGAARVVHHNYADRWCPACETKFQGRPCCARLIPTFVAEPIPCAVRAPRAAMDDDQFWADVYGDHQGPEPDPVWMEDEPLEEIPFSSDNPCTECGATGPCSYDHEGRPLIHLQAREDGQN